MQTSRDPPKLHTRLVSLHLPGNPTRSPALLGSYPPGSLFGHRPAFLSSQLFTPSEQFQKKIFFSSRASSQEKAKKKCTVPGTTMDNSPLLIHVRHTLFSRFTLSSAPPARDQSLRVGPHPSNQKMGCPCTGHSLQPGHLPGLTLNASRFYPIRAPEYIKKTMGALPHWYVSFPVYTK